MGDTVFEVLLNKTVAIERGSSEVGFEGEVRSPSYQRIAENVKANLMPMRALRYGGIPGGYPEVSHIGYLEAGYDIEPGDAIVWKVSGTVLSATVEAGELELPVADPSGFEDGADVEIGDGDAREAVEVAEVCAVSLGLDEAIQAAHEAGETVMMVRRFEVIDTRSWPGLEHHVEVGLKA